MQQDIVTGSVALGTMTFGDTVDESVASRMVGTALDRGATMIDTANGYAGGESERMLSRILPHDRSSFRIATKAGMPTADAAGRPPLSRSALVDSVNNSLRRLNLDYVDVLYLHQPDRETPLDETVTAIADLHTAGKIRAIGVSNFSAWQVADVIATADALGAPAPVVGQQLYNLVARNVEREYMEFARTRGLLTMVYNPLAGGLLTGKHALTQNPSSGRFATSGLSAMYRKRYWTPELFDAVARLHDVARVAEISLVEASFRWLLSRQAVDAVLVGGSSLEQLQQNFDYLDKGPLDAQIVDELDEQTAPLFGAMPPYNR
ncbi:aldo/keto reductase [Paramicrobacterium chengjingii]|nr:aldo/keto reductase [Microbacterium chengjingii]